MSPGNTMFAAPPTVVPMVPQGATRPLPSLVGSAVTSSAATNVLSALIAASTVAAVVARGSTSIVSAAPSKVTMAWSPDATLLSRTISTLSNSDPDVSTVSTRSLSSPNGAITARAVTLVRPMTPKSAIGPLPSLVGSDVVSRAAANVPSALISASTVAAVVASGSTPIVSVAAPSKATTAWLPAPGFSTNTT